MFPSFRVHNLFIVTKAAAYRLPSALIGPPHSHPQEWQIMYVVHASGRVQIGEEWHDVRPRDVYIIKPGQKHASEDKPRAQPELWEIRLALTDGISASTSGPFIALPDIMRDVRDPALLEMLRQLIDEFSARQCHWERLSSLLAEALMWRLDRLAHGGRRKPSARRRGGQHMEAIAHVRRFIHFNFAEPLTVAQLARQANMSPRRFASVFREICGMPPKEYVLQIRLERAAELLREGSLTVSEIAAQTGFASVHYFSRLFRQRRGLAPTTYRHLG